MSARGFALDRFVCALDVELDSGRTRIGGRGLDLTDYALVCALKGPIEPGTTVQVHLRLVLDWGASEALALTGHVLWSTATEGAHQVGVLFPELAGDTRQRIGVLLRVLTGAIALPSPGR